MLLANQQGGVMAARKKKAGARRASPARAGSKKSRSAKAGTRKSAGKASARRRLPRGSDALKRIEPELPRELQDFSRRVRRGLVRLEQRIETAQQGARRRFTRLLREVSHQLGRLEAEGERRWKQQTYPARREAVKLLKRLEKAIEPPRSRPARKKKAAATRARPTTV